MSLYLQLKDYQIKVNQVIGDFFCKKEREFAKTSEVKSIISDLKNFVLRGGKRLRGFLTFFSFKLFGGKDEKDILEFSAGVELLHAALLIHDDIIDKDVLRRGQATLHEKYHQIFPSFLAKQIAQNAANLLSTFGLELCLKTNFSPQIKVKVLLYLRQKLFQTALGEILDVHFSGRHNLAEKEIFRIYTLKTAGYTMEAPFFCGATLAGESLAKIKKFRRWLIKLGQAFQIKDDVLGMFGQEEIVGKPIGSDLKEGKMTLVFKKVLDFASLAQRRKFLKYFGKEKIFQEEINEILQLFSHLNIPQKVEKEAEKITQQTKKEILKTSFPYEKKKLLLELVDFVIKREK